MVWSNGKGPTSQAELLMPPLAVSSGVIFRPQVEEFNGVFTHHLAARIV